MSGRHGVAALFVVFLLAGQAEGTDAGYIDLRNVELLVGGDAVRGREKAATCIACHGQDGISPAPVFPHLAGQTPEYLYWSLADYRRGTRPESPMTAIVALLDDHAFRDLAMFYGNSRAPGEQRDTGTGNRTVDAGAGETGESMRLRRGEDLYRRGDPRAGIPPCQGCHGPGAEGHPLAQVPGPRVAFYRTFPALKGQTVDFLAARLRAYRDGTLADSTNDFIMAGAARGLDDDSIRAVAAWLAGGAVPEMTTQ